MPKLPAKPRPDSGMTRLLNALKDDTIPRFVHPRSRVLLTKHDSYQAVYHVLHDETHPDRTAIITAALDAISLKTGSHEATQ